MFTIFEARIEPLLAAGFVITVTLWLVLSAWVVLDRLRYDRNRRKLGLLRRSLGDPKLGELSHAERAALVRQLLDPVSTRDIYRMAGDDELPGWVREESARMALAVIGLPQMLRDATPHRGARRKWRRVSVPRAGLGAAEGDQPEHGRRTPTAEIPRPHCSDRRGRRPG